MDIRIAILGCGYWGPNLIRNFYEQEFTKVVCVCDVAQERLLPVRKRYPDIEVSCDPMAVLRRADIDAVVIATPIFTHFALAKAALENQKHILVEKPLAPSVEEAKQLVDLAAKYKRTLMVDHTFVYTGAVMKIHQLISEGSLGDIYYYDSVRANLGLLQRDVNVVWDLATHDLSIIDYIFSKSPVAVSATAGSHVGKTEEVAYITVFFEDNRIAHLHVNWLSPVKIRKTLIGGSLKMLVYDDVEPSEKIRVYDKGVDMVREEHERSLRVSYRSGDIWTPKLKEHEALSEVANEFLSAILEARPALTDGISGLRVVKLLEAAARSIKMRGQEIKI